MVRRWWLYILVFLGVIVTIILAFVIPRGQNANVSALLKQQQPVDYVSIVWKGGLGNQLFQLVTAFSYARRTGKTLVFDTSITTVPVNRPCYFTSLFKWVRHHDDLESILWKTYKETDFHYARIPDIPASILLNGYFQSRKYFADCMDEVRDLLLSQVKIPIWRETVLGKNIVSMHIRRGDYVGNEKHETVKLSYYHKCLGRMVDLLKGDSITVLVFSDDLKWCRSTFSDTQVHQFVYLADNISGSDYMDMLIMSECDHHILANSSFSWWAANLNQSKNSHVMAPKAWFSTDSDVSSWADIYCDGWEVIDN
jgi:hypothetical protein